MTDDNRAKQGEVSSSKQNAKSDWLRTHRWSLSSICLTILCFLGELFVHWQWDLKRFSPADERVDSLGAIGTLVAFVLAIAAVAREPSARAGFVALVLSFLAFLPYLSA